MSANEDVKRHSGYLRGTIPEALAADTATFEHDDQLVLKFHGIYQQDNRDVRRERAQKKLPLDYSCMVRTSIPGGVVTPEQWLALDKVAHLGNGSLRFTTRQDIQFHVVHKGELAELVRAINDALLTTLAACGDVTRNTMACPLPTPERRAVLDPLVAGLVRRFRPQTPSYWEVWVDGERAVTSEPPPADGPTEPIYGDAYLPRKFKFGVAWPGDNCIDVHANDVGLVPTLSEGTTGDLTGFMVFAGGSMGQSHSRPDDTFPRLALPVAWVPPEHVLDVCEAIVTTQRDFGNREDRQRARLKYLIDERGIPWLRHQITARTGLELADPVELPPWEHHAHHGWQGDDVFGLPIPSGRVVDQYRKALTEIVERGLVGGLRITARQDALFVGITDAEELFDVLRTHGIPLPDDVTPLRRLAIACPALPTCGQALGEAERALPGLVDELEHVLVDTGNEGLAVRLNMTGCPNGCARPYNAEIGISGRSKKTYDVYLGGSATGERLGELVRADVPLTEIGALLRPVLERYAARPDRATTFGDWCRDNGVIEIGTWLPEPTVRRRRAEAGV